MNTKLLRYVLMIAEERSFSSAAKRLFLSQPSLSQSISTLEKELGTPLFDRATMPLSLTYAGDIYVKMAQQILNLERQTTMQIDDIIDNRSGRIIVGISLFRNSTLMPPIYNAFTTKYPKIQLSLVEATNDTLLQMAMSGKVDLAFLNNDNIGNMEHIHLFSDRLMLAIGEKNHLFQEYLSKPGYLRINFNELRNEPFALVTPKSNLRIVTERMFQDYGFIPHVAVETQNIEVCHRLSAQTNLVAPILQSVIPLHQYSGSNKLKYLLPDLQDYVVDINICYPKTRRLPKLVTAFIETVKVVVEQEGWDKMLEDVFFL